MKKVAREMDAHRLRRLGTIGLCLALLGAAGARADSPPVIDCPWYSPTGGDNFATRAFYVPDYPGATLDTVTLYLSLPASGSWTLSLKANLNSFDGSLVGTANRSVSEPDNSFYAVTFDFGGIPVLPGSRVVFRGSVVSAPSGANGNVLMQTATSDSCQVIETTGTGAPLDSFRGRGIAVLITGDGPVFFDHTVTIPAAASIHGANGTFFHTDVWLYNRLASSVTITAKFYCYVGQSCSGGHSNFNLPGASAVTLSDVVGAGLFNAPETAGAITLQYSSTLSNPTVRVLSRTYSPSLPNPTTGAALPGLAPTLATGSVKLVGLANNGGDRGSGFRTNVGVYNPYPYPATVTFQLMDTSGNPIGQAVTQVWGANEARQINDIFGAAGAEGTVTTDAVLSVTSTLAVYPYVTVIDNVTGDSIIEWN